MLQVDAAALLLLSLALAWPVSAVLARARWPGRAPRAGLVLWQAVGLGSGLGILTAGLTLAASRVGHDWLRAVEKIPTHWSELGGWGWSGLTLTVAVGLWLVGVALTSTVRVLRVRQAHRHRLAVIADAQRLAAGAGNTQEVLLVEHPSVTAYCLPGLRPKVVLTRGVLTSLSEGELTAVLAHERAHAHGRHDLVTQPFIAWWRTFPFLPTAHEALAAVDLLVEMLADDLAQRDCRPADLTSALHLLGANPSGLNGAAPTELVSRTHARLTRLETSTAPLGRSLTATAYAAAGALVLLPPLLLVLT